MAPAYENQTTGQVIVSDDPRPDLEALARWKQIPVPEESPVPPAGTPLTDAELAEAAAREAAAEETPQPPSDGDGDGVPAAAEGGSVEVQPSGGGDGATEAPAPSVPDESWTDEALDALATERGIKFRSNTTKATKVAKLTAPAD